MSTPVNPTPSPDSAPAPTPEPEPGLETSTEKGGEPTSTPPPVPEPDHDPDHDPNDVDEESDIEDGSVVNSVSSGRINGWTNNLIDSVDMYLTKLKYYRIISNFFYYEIKKREGRWSWIIILISTFTSGLTVLNNVDEKDFPIANFHNYINGTLTISSLTTSLIAAWMKKQQYVDRINELDRYTQKTNRLCEELEFEMMKEPSDKTDFGEFKQKQYPAILEQLSSIPSMTPREWKECIINISKNYPELLTLSGEEDEKMWPWHRWVNNGGERKQTNFQDTVINSYKKRWCC